MHTGKLPAPLLRRRLDLARRVDRRLCDVFIAAGRGHERYNDSVRAADAGDVLARCRIAAGRAYRGLLFVLDHRAYRVDVTPAEESRTLASGDCGCWHHARRNVIC